MSEKEEWRDVPGYGGHYMASSKGRIRGKRRVVTRKARSGRLTSFTYRARILRQHRSRQGNTVHIGIDGNRHTVKVHHMVLLAFIGSRPEGLMGCHNDGNCRNNRPDNLRWDTHSGNMADRKRHGRYAAGADHPMAKISATDVVAMRASGLTYRAAAERFGVSKTQVGRIMRGENHKGRQDGD